MEIEWLPWSSEAFERAQREKKNIMLSISAVWCHWCHVMDQTTFVYTESVKLINEHFIPVRVDTDKRPDINERYNQGGWPTTAVLMPDGRLLTGATYLPPEALAGLLEKCRDFYRRDRDRGDAHLRNAEGPAPSPAAG